jgi:hypothetical protein
MRVDDFLRYFPEYPGPHFPERPVPTNEQIAYCRYLESVGKKFLVDFGFENCESITWAEIRDKGRIQ